jgi:hypothetical protein
LGNWFSLDRPPGILGGLPTALVKKTKHLMKKKKRKLNEDLTLKKKIIIGKKYDRCKTAAWD